VTDDAIYSPAEVAKMLGVHPETILAWLRSGELPGRKVGKRGGRGPWLISGARLRAWVELRDEEGSGDGIAIPTKVGRPVGGRDQHGASREPEDDRPVRGDSQGSRRAPARAPKARAAGDDGRGSGDDRWVPPVVAGHRRKAKPQGVDVADVHREAAGLVPDPLVAVPDLDATPTRRLYVYSDDH
jgi:excisionase family DNA binding protein